MPDTTTLAHTPKVGFVLAPHSLVTSPGHNGLGDITKAPGGMPLGVGSGAGAR